MLIPKVVTSLVNDLIVLDDVRGYQGTVVKIPALAHNVDLTTMAPELLLAESTHLQHLVSANLITVNSYFDTSALNANGLATALAGDVVTSSGALVPGAADLGTAAGMAVLAASTTTAVGTETLTGDLGLYPGTSVTGAFSVSGTRHITDASAEQAQADAMTAYTNLQGRTPNQAANTTLSSATLTAGIYPYSSSASLTGTLTLNGSATSVFIFQIATTLTTATSSSVVLGTGVLAQNVFWQVGSSATLGTTSTMVGTVIALDSISVGTGATVTGHLMALTAAATFAGTGSVASSGEPVGTEMATVTSVGGSTAASIHTSQLLTAAATSDNTASTLVMRDAYGGFIAGNITATSFIGSLTGNADTATAAGSTTVISGITVTGAPSGSFGQVLTGTSATEATWTAPAGSGAILAFTSAASSTGAAQTVAVTGLLSTDTILAVTAILTTSATVALNGFTPSTNGQIVLHWTADPGVNSTALITVKR